MIGYTKFQMSKSSVISGIETYLWLNSLAFLSTLLQTRRKALKSIGPSGVSRQIEVSVVEYMRRGIPCDPRRIFS